MPDLGAQTLAVLHAHQPNEKTIEKQPIVFQ